MSVDYEKQSWMKKRQLPFIHKGVCSLFKPNSMKNTIMNSDYIKPYSCEYIEKDSNHMKLDTQPFVYSYSTNDDNMICSNKQLVSEQDPFTNKIQYYNDTINYYDEAIKMINELGLSASRIVDDTIQSIYQRKNQLENSIKNTKNKIYNQENSDTTEDEEILETKVDIHVNGIKRIQINPSLVLDDKLCYYHKKKENIPNYEKYNKTMSSFNAQIEKESDMIYWGEKESLRKLKYQQADEEIDTDLEALDYGKSLSTKNVMQAYKLFKNMKRSSQERIDKYYESVEELEKYSKK
ncbi:hypothetical protein WA158_004811 [Blastocystis sp. Blastoise]